MAARPVEPRPHGGMTCAWEDGVVHEAFFRIEGDKSGMSSVPRRRVYRR